MPSLPTWLAAFATIHLCACAGPKPVMGDRKDGPDFKLGCPGPRWSSPVSEYSLQAGLAFHLPPEGVEAGPGDRVVGNFHRIRFSDGPVEAGFERSEDGGRNWAPVEAARLVCFSSDTGTLGELGPEALDCVGRKQVRFSHEPGSPARFRLALRAAGAGKAFVGRVRLQVAPTSCRALDTCWRASGNNCDGAPASNCAEDEAGMLACPTSVGSQAHDSCCSRWDARGYVCGKCGSPLNDKADLARCKLTEPPAELPARLISSPSGEFPGGYVPCRAEWDMAFRDVGAIPQRLWSFRFDPLDIVYRPTEITRLTVHRGKPAAIPLEGAYRFPKSAILRRADAELGWCESGRWHETDPGLAECE